MQKLIRLCTVLLGCWGGVVLKSLGKVKERPGHDIPCCQVLQEPIKVQLPLSSYVLIRSFETTQRGNGLNTSGLSMKLESSTDQQMSNFFNAGVVNSRNSLPDNVVKSQSVSSFENQYDTFLET